jgi:hypothetical protein
MKVEEGTKRWDKVSIVMRWSIDSPWSQVKIGAAESPRSETAAQGCAVQRRKHSKVA